MIGKKEFKELSGEPCPYGRKVIIGSRDCENCAFHRIEETVHKAITEARCEGDTEQVEKHEKRFNEIINHLKNL